MITGNNGSRLESWLHAWSMRITRKSKRRTVSHADTSLISLPNDSSSIRHRFFSAKISRTSFCHRVQKCMIATVTEAHLTAFVSGKKFRFSVHCNVQFYLKLLHILHLLPYGNYTLTLLYIKFFHTKILYTYLSWA